MAGPAKELAGPVPLKIWEKTFSKTDEFHQKQIKTLEAHKKKTQGQTNQTTFF